MFFAKSTMGFYSKDLHGEDMPVDAVEISHKEYMAFRNGQASGLILSEVNGRPVMVPYVVSDSDIRQERNRKLVTEVDPIAGNALRWAELSAEQQQAWADYRQGLLDVPQQAGFPHDVVWPQKPE